MWIRKYKTSITVYIMYDDQTKFSTISIEISKSWNEQ